MDIAIDRRLLISWIVADIKPDIHSLFESHAVLCITALYSMVCNINPITNHILKIMFIILNRLAKFRVRSAHIWDNCN